MPFGIIIGMKSTVTIDKAGRMVLPQVVRRQFGLHPGSALDLRVTADSIVLYPAEKKSALSKEHGLYVHEGRPESSLLNAVESARDDRDRAAWGGAK